MSNEVSSTVDAFINRILPPAKKELKYIQEEDWSEIKSVKARSNSYNVQHIITDRNVKYAIKLYKMAEEDIGKKRVKAALEILISFFKILEERYNRMIETFDYTSFDHEDDAQASKIKNEVEFQSEVLKNVNDMETKLIAINFGGESENLHIEFHGNQKIPFMMSEAMEQQYPDIKKHLEKKYAKK